MMRWLMAVILTAGLTAGPVLAQPSTASVVKEKTEAAFKEYLKGGNLLAGEGKFEPAIQSYRKALALNPQSAEAYSLLGAALAETGKAREAEEALRKSVALKPDFAEGYFHLGTFLKSQNREPEAQEAFRKAKQYQRR
jgi:Flp pilus assembly protein TadD